MRRKIPFVLVTGYGENNIPTVFAEAPMLAKPYAIDVLQTLVCRFGEPSSRA
jgi:hypothetical protein